MSEPRHILFALLRCGLHPADSTAAEAARRLLDSGAEWQSVYKLAARQGVLAIVWDGLQQLPAAASLPDNRLRMQWAFNVDAIESRYRRQKRAISGLADFYASHDIRMMILKGYGLSLCYPQPEHRPCGDVDIWLFGRQREADALLHGERGVEIDEEKHHHTIFSFDGVTVENHYDFLNVKAQVSNRGIERLLHEQVTAASAERVEVDGRDVCLPPANFNALFLLRHTARHFAAENIGLRHVADWAMFVERYASQIDWQWLEQVAREHNMHRFMESLNAMAAECAGTDAGLFPPMTCTDEALRTRVLNEVLTPEFAAPMPSKGALRRAVFRFRRWWANRWKHRMVYRDGLLKGFFVQIYSHLSKPSNR